MESKLTDFDALFNYGEVLRTPLVLYLGLKLTIHVIKSQIHLVRKSL
jgi:hypothetical protein